MISKSKKSAILFSLGAVFLTGQIAQSQTISRATVNSNVLVITVDGQQKTVAKDAFKAWVIDAGKAAVWTSGDGAGGYENEGQSLWSYDAKTGQKRRLAADYFPIENLHQARSRTGKLALVLSMRDGGLGGPHLSVVDPKRGIVWRQQMARLTGIRNGRLAVGLVTEEAVSNGVEGQPPKVSRLIYLSVDKLLKRRVITLPRRPEN